MIPRKEKPVPNVEFKLKQSWAKTISDDKACILQVVTRLEYEMDGLRAHIEYLSHQNLELIKFNKRLIKLEKHLGLRDLDEVE